MSSGDESPEARRSTGDVAGGGHDGTQASSDEVEAEIVEAIASLVPPQRVSDVRNAIRRVLLQREESFFGPLPHPTHWERYERTLSGAADRILTMAEAEQAHRHRWEIRHLAFDGWQGILGQLLGAVILAALIAASVYCAAIDQPEVAAAFLGVAALGAVGAIIRGRVLRSRSDAASPAEMTEHSLRRQGKRSR